MIQREFELTMKYVEMARHNAELRGEKFMGYDVGCGPRRQPSSTNQDRQMFRDVLLGVDVTARSEPDIVCDLYNLSSAIKPKSAHFVVLSHVMEDLERPYDGLRQVKRILKAGGILCLICPHPNYYPHITHPKANPGHKFDILPETLRGMVKIVFKDRPYRELSFDTLQTNWSYEVVVEVL